MTFFTKSFKYKKAQLTEDEEELFEAVKQGNIDKAKELLDKGINVNVRGDYSWTPLHLAARNKHVDLTKFLLEYGADINARSISGRTPLYYAVWNRYTDIVKLLLNHGANVDVRDNEGWTSLHLAVYYGYIDIVKLLLDHGANPDIENNEGKTPIDIAKERGYNDIVQLLEEYSKPWKQIEREFGKIELSRYKKAQHMSVNKQVVLAFMNSYIQSMGEHPFYPKETQKGLLSEGFWTAIEYYKQQIRQQNIDMWKQEVERNTGITLYSREQMVVLTSSQVVSPEYFALLYQAWVQDVKDNVPSYVDVDVSFDSWLDKTIVGHALREHSTALRVVKELVRQMFERGEIESTSDVGEIPVMEEEEESVPVTVWLSNLYREKFEKSFIQKLLYNEPVTDEEIRFAILNRIAPAVLYRTKVLSLQFIDLTLEVDGPSLFYLYKYQNLNSTQIDKAIEIGKYLDVLIKCQRLSPEQEKRAEKKLVFLHELNKPVSSSYKKAQLTEDEKKLFRAVRQGDIDKIKELLDKGVSVNVVTNASWSLLYLAVYYEYVDIVKLLLDHGADVNAVNMHKETPLHEAVYHGRVDIVKLLLDHGADVNAQSENGYTPLHCAASAGHADTDIAKLLLDYGANPDIKNKEGKTPIDIAKERGYSGVVRLLVGYSKPWELMEEDFGKIELSRYKKAQLTEDEKKLFEAVKQGNIDKIKELLDKGVNVNVATSVGWTPLHVAVYCGCTNIVKLLLNHGADVNVRDNDGWTPLLFTAYYGREDIVKLLLNHGADLDIKNKEGKTPIDIAKEEGYDDIARLLEKHRFPWKQMEKEFGKIELSRYKKAQLTSNDDIQSFKFILVNTPEKKRLGLMYVKSLDKDKCLLFTDICDTDVFHTWNCYFPIDFVCLDGNKRVLSVKVLSPDLMGIRVDKGTRYVIEANTGVFAHLKPGDVLDFSDHIISDDEFFVRKAQLMDNKMCRTVTAGQERIIDNKLGEELKQRARNDLVLKETLQSLYDIDVNKLLDEVKVTVSVKREAVRPYGQTLHDKIWLVVPMCKTEHHIYFKQLFLKDNERMLKSLERDLVINKRLLERSKDLGSKEEYRKKIEELQKSIDVYRGFVSKIKQSIESVQRGDLLASDEGIYNRVYDTFVHELVHAVHFKLGLIKPRDKYQRWYKREEELEVIRVHVFYMLNRGCTVDQVMRFVETKYPSVPPELRNQLIQKWVEEYSKEVRLSIRDVKLDNGRDNQEEVFGFDDRILSSKNIRLSNRVLTADLESRLPVLKQQVIDYRRRQGIEVSEAEQEVRRLNQYDPTGNRAEYTPWIVRIYLLNPEVDLERVRIALEQLLEIRKYNLLPKGFDVLQFRTVEELESNIIPIYKEVLKKKEHKEKVEEITEEIKTVRGEVVYKEGEYEVVRVDKPEDIVRFLKERRIDSWCVDELNEARDYAPVYFVFQGSKVILCYSDYDGVFSDREDNDLFLRRPDEIPSDWATVIINFLEKVLGKEDLALVYRIKANMSLAPEQIDKAIEKEMHLDILYSRKDIKLTPEQIDKAIEKGETK